MTERGVDADALAAAERPWTVTVRGRAYRARPLSYKRMGRFFAEVAAAPPEEEERLLVALLREAFPHRLSMRWRGDPVTLIAALSPSVRREVLRDFFLWARGTPSETSPEILTRLGWSST